ncbi:MAG TPA: polysaccharide deacetylase family protein [Gemmatimonadaceae bacterium]|nr:polysaccharide deacetylase family protein [Gemmatimonadaceae bacterium]
MSERPLCSISLDLDDLWSYMKIRGDQRWVERPSYLPTFLPLALDTLEELGLRITFFVVGYDATVDTNAKAMESLVTRGHEVGNHSFEHDSWLHLYSRDQLTEEIVKAENALTAVTGQRPRGFRGPGYSWSETLLEVLAGRDYLYDASTLPTYLGPLARAYYFATAGKGMSKTPERKTLFGTFRDGLRPVGAYEWALRDGHSLLEIPVTTIPGIKTPFHFSYLLFLARRSEALAFGYLRTALALCRAAGVEPSFLLHPLDLMGGDELHELAFFPGMDLSTKRKQALFKKALGILTEEHTPVTMSTHATAIRARARLARRVPDAATASASTAAAR